MPRPRFTLRTLLIVVAVCAVGILVYSRLPNTLMPSELDGVALGMTPDEVRALIGEPSSMRRTSDSHGIDEEVWYYSVWGGDLAPTAVMGFQDGGVCWILR